jgi:hypothetical protein
MTSPLELFVMYLAMAFCISGVVLLVRKVRTRSQQQADAEAIQKGRDMLRRAVTAGTHDEQGFPLCRVCGDKNKPETRATRPGYQINRSEGFWAWARQMVGAPARLSIGRKLFEDHVYCRECALVAEQTLSAYLLAFEQQRRDQIRDAEVELRRFERAGLDERVRAWVAAHDKEQARVANRPPAQVLPFRAQGS